MNDIDWLANPIREAYDGSPLEIALAVLEAIRSAGYVVVPREPTEVMKMAGFEAEVKANPHKTQPHKVVPAIYQAMIAAAD